MKVRYQDGYRFQLAAPFQVQTGIRCACPGNAFVGLDASGVLTLAAGYAWDGASGPIKQDATVIRASLVHDGLYQLMRDHELPDCRETADKLLRTMCKEDGMPGWQAWIVYTAVRMFGAQYASPSARKPILEAP